MKSVLILAMLLSAANAHAGFLDDLFTWGHHAADNAGHWIPNFGNDPAHPQERQNPRSPVVEKGLAPGSTTAAVWAVRNQWDDSWEAKYQAWVTRSWNVDIFTHPNSPYVGLLPDCADAVYSMRAIFASENGLPFAVVD
ncbi:MAG: hypothetical protein ACXWQO_15815, partial [Bdellovibrionota bacterium]